MARTCAPRYALSLLLSALAPTLGVAQADIVSKIFSKVTDVTAAYVTGTPAGRGILSDSGRGLGSLRGLSIEVLFNLGSLWRKETTIEKDSTAPGGRKRVSCDAAGYDSTLIETEVRRSAQREVDSVYKMTRRKPPVGCDIVGAELGLGYSELRGFRGGGTLGVQGSIQELPALSVYLSWYPHILDNNEVTVYLGVRTGFVQLKDFRAVTGDSLIVAAGSSFQLGPTAGLAFGKSGQWSVFAETALTYRTIDGVSWSGAKVQIPAPLQKPLRPSTFTLSLGGQISIASALAAAP